MGFITLVIFAGVLLPSLNGLPCEKHSLYYVYTALSKPVNVPGIFEFTGMGLLDDRKIDYYNSVEKIKKPQQEWMKEKLAADYWEKGTQSRRSKEQWFKVNVNILMERKRQNNSDIHVLNWRHGCEVEKSNDGTIKFIKGVDEYSYDGVDFLSFNDAEMHWVAPVPEAFQTKMKWDGVPILNQYTKGYLEKECVEWLTKFMGYADKEMQKCSKPNVHLFAKTSKTSSDHLRMTCFATGFLPKDIDMSIRRSSHIVLKATDLDVLPNGDGTHQARLVVEVPKSEANDYECRVNHRTLSKPVVINWPEDGKNTDETSPAAIIGGIIGGLVGVAALIGGVITGIVVYRKRQGNRTVERTASSAEGEGLITEGATVDITNKNTSLTGSNGSQDSGLDAASTGSNNSGNSNSGSVSSGRGSGGSQGEDRTVERTPSPTETVVLTTEGVTVDITNENTSLPASTGSNNSRSSSNSGSISSGRGSGDRTLPAPVVKKWEKDGKNTAKTSPAMIGRIIVQGSNGSQDSGLVAVSTDSNNSGNSNSGSISSGCGSGGSQAEDRNSCDNVA